MHGCEIIRVYLTRISSFMRKMIIFFARQGWNLAILPSRVDYWGRVYYYFLGICPAGSIIRVGRLLGTEEYTLSCLIEACSLIFKL